MIDLRSDTVTRPTPAMYQAMNEAKLGDDVYDDDPTVHQLQDMAAEMLGFEKALFFPTGTQSNLVALLSHCGRGEEYITGDSYHIYKFEGGGGAVLGSIQPQPVPVQANGTLDLQDVEKRIKPHDFHFARSKLLSLENTHGGRVIGLDYIERAAQLARKHKLAFHLDGARAFNAAVKLGVTPKQITRHFDSVSICLSKGLCTPAGSLLLGSAELIEQAMRWRKMVGGGMRQSGILAACGIVALEQQIERLQQDHDNAELLAQRLGEIDNLQVMYDDQQTNMVFLTIDPADSEPLIQFMREQGMLISARYQDVRLVLHKDINRDDVTRTVEAFQRYYSA